MTLPAQTSSRRNALLDQLCELYSVFKEGVPLAIGIHKQILEKMPELEKANLRTAMRLHTHSTRYLKGVVAGAPRFDLERNAAGEVTEEQQEQAASMLKDRFKNVAERRKAEQEAQRAEQKAEREAQERQEKLAKLADKFNIR